MHVFPSLCLLHAGNYLSSLLAPCWECFLAQNSASISILWTRSWCVYVMILLIHQQAAEIASWRGFQCRLEWQCWRWRVSINTSLLIRWGVQTFFFFPPNFLNSLVIFSSSSLGIVFWPRNLCRGWLMSSQAAMCSCTFSLTWQGDDPSLWIEMRMGRCELHEKQNSHTVTFVTFFLPPLPPQGFLFFLSFFGWSNLPLG